MNNEEVKNEVVEQPTEAEQEARSQGWVPQEEFEGDKSKWVDAAEFVRRGELFRKIDTQNRELKETKKTLAALKEHYTKVEEAAFNRALAALKAQKVQAQEDGEFRKASELEEEIRQVEQQKEDLKESIPDVPPEIHPELAAWVERNSWYRTNPRMKAVADAIGAEHVAQGIHGPALLKIIDAEIRREFPSKFTNPNREKPSSVESGGNRGTSSKKEYALTEQEERIFKTLSRDPNLKMTREQYIADLKLAKGEK